ncbi:hypothetical protein [Streptomyces sp. KLOTTS4A1]|uniref:hypothetical protein n=1 Tax=Streptomyces sp. KLOTTS4A1 TaxID=3390996 RepID=UPI0039F4D6C0
MKFTQIVRVRAVAGLFLAGLTVITVTQAGSALGTHSEGAVRTTAAGTGTGTETGTDSEDWG